MTSFLRHRRTALRMSQGQLADLVKVSQQTIARWETSGQIPAKYIKDLAIVMGARSDDFLPRGSESPARLHTSQDDLQSGAPEGASEEDEGEFGDVHFHFSGVGGLRRTSFPVTWGSLNRIQSQLGDVGIGADGTVPWVQFETLNNKWVAVNTREVERVTFLDDNVEEMSFHENVEVYRAARELWANMPSPERVLDEDFAFTPQLVERVKRLIEHLGRGVHDELDGVTLHFVSGERLCRKISPDAAYSLDNLFTNRSEADLEGHRYLQLAFRDHGAFEHVRLGGLRCIEASLLAFEEACQSDSVA
jgi:transcriptional regulator with XRE-family HTH domain